MLEIIKSVGFTAFTCLIVAAFIGFSFLKFYEEFRKGVAQNSRIRIWSSFFGAAFVIIFFTIVALRLVK